MLTMMVSKKRYKYLNRTLDSHPSDTCLETEKIIEFYSESKVFMKKIRSNREFRRLSGKKLDDITVKEDVVAFEWFAYFVARASMFSVKMIEERHINSKMCLDDIEIKHIICRHFLAEERQQEIQLFMLDGRKIEVIRLEWLQLIFKTLADESNRCIKSYETLFRDFIEQQKRIKKYIN